MAERPEKVLSGFKVRQLEERHVSIKIDLMVLSDKMDLVALSNTKGEVTIHRLNWQKVWTLPPPSPEFIVRKIAWRPDGAVIAIAYVPRVMIVGEEVKGEVKLVNVESMGIQHTIEVTDDVSCLLWLFEKKPGEVNQNVAGPSYDPSSDFLLKLPSLSYAFGTLVERIEEDCVDTKRINNQTPLNFLLIGTCDGCLHLSVIGLFSCGTININKYMTDIDEGKHVSVLNAEMTPDMKSLYLLVAIDIEKSYAEIVTEEVTVNKRVRYDASKKENTESLAIESMKHLKIADSGRRKRKRKHSKQKNITPNTATKTRELKLLVLDTRVLASRSRDLHALSVKHEHILFLLNYLAETMHSIIEAWENIYLLEIGSKVSALAKCVPEGSLSADFLELLMIGVPSDSLEDFLLNDVDDKMIKKLGNSIEQSYCNMQKLMLKSLLSVGQSLAYHLTEMKGMVNLADRFKVLGLEEERVIKAFNSAGSFLLKTMEVQMVIHDNMKQYQAFFRWLYTILLNVPENNIRDMPIGDFTPDIEGVANYLYKLDIKTDDNGVIIEHCHLDRLGQYFLNKNLTISNDKDESNLWPEMLDENPLLHKQFSVIKKCKHTSLVQEYENLKEAIKNVFHIHGYSIWNKFIPSNIIPITDVPYSKLSMCLENENLIVVSLIEANSLTVFQVIKISIGSTNCYVTSNPVSLKSSERVMLECLDLQFYSPNVLSVLLEEIDENRSAVIVQVMTKSVQVTNKDSTLEDYFKLQEIPNVIASTFAVSGRRKLAIVLSESRRKVKLFEMEAEDDDEDDEEDEEETDIADEAGHYEVAFDNAVEEKRFKSYDEVWELVISEAPDLGGEDN